MSFGVFDINDIIGNNSGGLIGPVGGLSKKLKAASENGIKRVLIPKGSRYHTENNATTDLVEYGKEIGLEVIEVSTLAQALYYFTGREIKPSAEELVIQKDYQEIMERVSYDL